MDPTNRPVRLALPKGRMQQEISRLLDDAGIRLRVSQRDYRPSLSLPGFEAKILKPRNVIGMLEAGARDLGFAGADWVEETGANLVELCDTRLDPVRLVAAAPSSILEGGRLPNRPIVVASEYESLAKRWIDRTQLDARVLTTFGATEVFPPEDADCIIDNTATGSTLRANGLTIIDEVLTSSTRLYANPAALENPVLEPKIRNFAVLLESVLEARRRVMIDLNVAASDLERVIEFIPCMREPSISRLHEEGWFAVRAAIPRDRLAEIIPALKAAGARDLVTSRPEQIIP
jgi:ATP phosphoribosyltransferase